MGYLLHRFGGGDQPLHTGLQAPVPQQSVVISFLEIIVFHSLSSVWVIIS
nr:MAG TPA: alpha toxin [Caudoviricetes sp.]